MQSHHNIGVAKCASMQSQQVLVQQLNAEESMLRLSWFVGFPSNTDNVTGTTFTLVLA